MAIERIDKFDIVKVAFGNSLSEIINNKSKMQENEIAVAITEKKICVKIGNEIYSTQLTLEGGVTS